MTAATIDANVTNERFGFTMFLSLCIHAALILGVGFNFYEDIRHNESLDITIAQYRSEVPPEEADFIAQENQSGSGNLEEKAAPSSPFDAPLSSDRIEEVNPLQQEAARLQPREHIQSLITTTADSVPLSDMKPDDSVPDTDTPTADRNMNREELSQSLASLQAQLDLQRQEYAKRPRRYTISSASTRKSHDAQYLDSWRKRIEAVGNQNYPEEASVEGLYGNLRLLVSLRPDGSVENIRILRSSGHTVLDQAAIRIVNQAAPFDPFPPEISESADILEIIRTWQFKQGNTFASF